MSRLIPVWTELHTRLIPVLLLVALGTAVAAAADPFDVAVPIGVLFALTAAAGLSFEPTLSLVPGLFGSAAMILLKQFTGRWDATAFAPSSLQTLFFLGTAFAASIAGTGLRRSVQRPEQSPFPMLQTPAVESLGLLPAELGELRLREEVDRARLHGRPVSVLRVLVELQRAGDAGESDRELEAEAASRAVARLIESTLRITDVPFAYRENCIVAILPETTAEEARHLAHGLAQKVGRIIYTVRPGDVLVRRAVSRSGRVRYGIAAFPEDGETGDGLLESSERSLTENPADPRGSGGTRAVPVGISSARGEAQGAGHGDG